MINERENERENANTSSCKKLEEANKKISQQEDEIKELKKIVKALNEQIRKNLILWDKLFEERRKKCEGYKNDMREAAMREGVE